MEFRSKEKKYEATERNLEKFESLMLVSIREDVYPDKTIQKNILQSD